MPNTSELIVTKNPIGITTFSINREKSRNSISLSLVEAFCSEIEKLEKEPSQRVLIIKGEGSVFCAGLDLKEASQKEKIEITAAAVAKLLKTIATTPLITIASVHGASIAGGMGILAACDLALASKECKFGLPETRRGLMAALVMVLLKNQVRERDLKELLFSGEVITADRALSMGLVNRIVSNANLLEETETLAKSILKGAPSATKQTKSFLQGLSSDTIESLIDKALNNHMKARVSDEAEEGILAFLEKREPNWSSPVLK